LLAGFGPIGRGFWPRTRTWRCESARAILLQARPRQMICRKAWQRRRVWHQALLLWRYRDRSASHPRQWWGLRQRIQPMRRRWITPLLETRQSSSSCIFHFAPRGAPLPEHSTNFTPTEKSFCATGPLMPAPVSLTIIGTESLSQTFPMLLSTPEKSVSPSGWMASCNGLRWMASASASIDETSHSICLLGIRASSLRLCCR